MSPRFSPLELDLLKRLRDNAETGVSFPNLAEDLQQSAEAIAAAVAALKSHGYQFSKKGERELKLIAPPDRLYVHEVQRGLNTRVIGRLMHSFDEIDSTNLRAGSLAQAGEPEGAVILAEMQSAGRGRLNRSWYSPLHGGIYASVILRPQVDLAVTPGISLLVAAAIAEAIPRLTGVVAKIKWPNDVLISDKKVAGVLADLAADKEGVNYLIIGFGVNVNQVASDFPPEIAAKATSVRLATGKPWSRVRLLQAILNDLEDRYFDFLARGLSAQLPALKSLSSVLMKRITFERQGRKLSGTAVNIDETGMLLVDVEGEILKLAAGEITLAECY